MPKVKTKKIPEDLSQDEILLKDAPAIAWIKVQSAIKLLWDENPKLHDIGSIADSISVHGFQELPKFDKYVGIKAGNGRVEAVAWMERDGGYELPRGLGQLKETGEWVMPILIGTDAVSVNMALSYAVDSNNLVFAGGDFSAYEQARVWDSEGYLPLLKQLADAGTLPVSVDGDDVDFMSYVSGRLPGGDTFKEYDEDIADDVEFIECPECGHSWAK